MREILFRGKNVDNGAWVYGSFIPDMLEVFCITDIDGFIKPFSLKKEELTEVRVERSTVGQYTGLTDKNGTKIFEGDIVRHIQEYKISGKVESIAVIKLNEAYTCWSVEYTNGRTTAFLGTEYHRIEVIGNVHDNPELMEVNQNG